MQDVFNVENMPAYICSIRGTGEATLRIDLAENVKRYVNCFENYQEK